MTQTAATSTEFVNVDPRVLDVEVNVRTDVQLKPDFVGSIAQHSVLVPVIARRDETGALRVIAGQRRTLAAVKSGVSSIPVRILEGLDTGRARIVAQIIENDQREALTEAERVIAYEQLAAFGMSPTEIGKKLNTRRVRVQKGLKVGADATASAALAEHGLTLDQAAVLAEVSDNEDDVARLLDGAARGTFDHEAKRVQDARTERTSIAKAAAELTEQGVTVIDYAQTNSAARPSRCRRWSTGTAKPSPRRRYRMPWPCRRRHLPGLQPHRLSRVGVLGLESQRSP